MTLTSHQHLIPSSVELLVGAVVQRASASSSQTAHTQADYVSATFQRLGCTRLDSNERSDFRAREVKTVHVNDATGHFLKLIVNEATRLQDAGNHLKRLLLHVIRRDVDFSDDDEGWEG